MANQFDFTLEDKRIALLEWIYNGRNAPAAVRSLKAKNYPRIPTRETLSSWGRSMSEEVQDLEHRHSDEISKRLAGTYEALAIAQNEVEIAVLERIQEELPNLPPRELANVLRNLAVSSGVNTDKSLLLRGKPTVITKRQGVEELIGDLARTLGFDVDSTAIDVSGPTQEPPNAIAAPPLSDSPPSNGEGLDGDSQ